MRHRPLPSLLLCLSLAACADFPELGDAEPLAGAESPVILPLDQLIAGAQGGRITEATGSAVAARAALLRVRAAAMRGPVHDPATRARLAAAISGG